MRCSPLLLHGDSTYALVRQMDVVDDIARRFRFCVANYDHSTISFSNAPRKKDSQPKERYTPRQGQYLAFIHYGSPSFVVKRRT